MKRDRHFLTLLPLLLTGLLLPVFYTSRPPAAGARDAPRPRTTPAKPQGPDERLVLGVLEHQNSDEGKGHNVRVVFYKENDGWKAFPANFNTEEELSRAAQSFPESLTWTVCLDGRANGSLASRNPESIKFYKDVGTQQITSKGSVPTVGKPSEQFSGWPGGLTYRPLVLNSRPNCADAGGWRPEQPGVGEINGIKGYLQKEFKVPAARLAKARLKANKSYGSQARGAKLISLNITGAKVVLTPGEDDQNLDAWFYVKGKEVRYLGSNMQLVDAGDYDGDGAEEALFKVQRYNNDGYTLYSNVFAHKVEFSWSYH